MMTLGEWKVLCLAALLGITTKIPAPAQDFTTLGYFSESNGANPSLVQGIDGNYYGTQPNAAGTVFTVTPKGVVTVLNYLNNPHGPFDPAAGLVLGSDGNLYGTTWSGGASGDGTVFKITSRGHITVLYSFCDLISCTDGSGPTTSLIQGADGNYYGTTTYGGRGPCEQHGCGTVFKISQSGALTTLYRFDRLKDGAYPRSVLIQATDGNFYGTTSEGGANDAGTVFKIAPTGKLTTLYSFCAYRGCSDGKYPLHLIQTTDGHFYGITQQGGWRYGECSRWLGCGTVYKMTVDQKNGKGVLTTLHAFKNIDGNQPDALIHGTDGNFYGETSIGGTGLSGTLFRITPQGHLSTLHNFCSHMAHGCPNGQFPQELFQATDGKFYGTTQFAINYGGGTFFRLDMSLAPFVSFVRGSGKVGQTAGVLGQGFDGAGKVSFNGIPAKFTVVSDTFIKATVPEGATTGYVTVITPSGRLKSNVVFHVFQ
jgi:uncharacterized repeat protein (TIGR03803 family)